MPVTDGPQPPVDLHNVNSAFAYLQGILTQYGLASLTQWAYDQITSGASQDEILQSLRNTPEYRDRFKAIAQLQQNGYNAMSESEVIAWENQARQIAIQAGLPTGFYDNPDDFANLIGNGLSVNEYQQRVQNGFQAVAQAPQEIRDYFNANFGADGPGALASYFLDKDKSAPLLLQQATAAEIGGLGKGFGFNVDKERALQLAQFNVTQGAAQQAFQQLDTRRGLFQARIGESSNLTAENQGLDSVLGTGSAVDVKNRLDTRKAAFSGGGGASVTHSGISGLGTNQG